MAKSHKKYGFQQKKSGCLSFLSEVEKLVDANLFSYSRYTLSALPWCTKFMKEFVTVGECSICYILYYTKDKVFGAENFGRVYG